MSRFLYSLLCSVLLLSLSACHHKEKEVIDPQPTVSHTLLIYMAGDNNGMGSEYKSNVTRCIEGLKKAEPGFNLVIFRDVNPNYPEIYSLQRNAKDPQRIDTVYLRRYEEHINTSDKDVLADVVNFVFETFPSQIKGFEYWSHGGSWLPDGWQPSAPKAADRTRATQYIGIDNYRYMQLWDLREALERCPHLDYITFDACNMATAEVAYELRDRCNYVLASAQEILLKGFPYSTMIPSLSKAGSEGVYAALCRCVDDMQAFYPTNGSLSLIKSSEMEPLATAYAQLLNANKPLLDELRRNGAEIEQAWQHHGGGVAINTFYCLYELEDVAEYLHGDLKPQLKAAVPYLYYADTYISAFHNTLYRDGHFPIDHFYGLAVSVPELFYLSTGKRYLNEGYHMTQWGQRLGY